MNKAGLAVVLMLASAPLITGCVEAGQGYDAGYGQEDSYEGPSGVVVYQPTYADPGWSYQQRSAWEYRERERYRSWASQRDDYWRRNPDRRNYQSQQQRQPQYQQQRQQQYQQERQQPQRQPEQRPNPQGQGFFGAGGNRPPPQAAPPPRPAPQAAPPPRPAPAQGGFFGNRPAPQPVAERRNCSNPNDPRTCR